MTLPQIDIFNIYRNVLSFTPIVTVQEQQQQKNSDGSRRFVQSNRIRSPQKREAESRNVVDEFLPSNFSPKNKTTPLFRSELLTF